MATIDLGKIRFNWQGAYNNSTAYVVNDVVSSGGNSYICKLASTGNAVSNGTYWDLMSQAGTNGTNGTDVGTVITTQGDVLYRDGSGLQRLAKGTASQQLAMNSSANAPEWITPSGGGLWEYIGTANFSAVTDVLVTGFTTDYRIEFYNMGFSTSGPNLQMFTTGDNTNFKTDAYYRYTTIMPTSGTGFDNWYQNSVGQIYLTNSGVGNDSGNTQAHFEIESVDASNTNSATVWLWRGHFVNQGGDNRYVTGGGQRTEYGSSPHNSSGIKINISSGNMTGSYRKYKRITA